ncbi:tetratricopeptide repeat protein [Chthonomonas calidirosea]|uniref:tetratricopeptide repeat protein n=1 Tax=Chthonomonas calidirosea TaxID=454171 RepID=UPI0006EC8E31|nr:tetratricopeptide repeat protein [Chthonomonas calidirosea]CEK20141.1 predicted ATPase [Chthonomonas calidirosea]
MWRIQMFGALQAEFGRYRIERFATKKASVLLVYLALHVGSLFPREELATLLWPDADEETGRHNLRMALSTLRKLFRIPSISTESLFIANRDYVGLRKQAVVTDVVEFDALLAEAQATKEAGRLELLSRAVSLYQGDLLPGFYEDFILLERQRLADKWQQALRELIVLLQKQEAFGQATEYAYRVLAYDPLDESVQYLLLQLLAAQGQHERALQRYQEIERLFQGQLQSSPPDSLQKLAEDIKKQLAGSSFSAPPLRALAPTTTAPLSNTLPLYLTSFFGREQELQIALEQLQPDRQAVRLVSITGPGGVGKTRFAVEIAHLLRQVYSEQIAFVPLAELSRKDQLVEAILAVLKVPSDTSLMVEERLRLVLSNRKLLLVLDNFEQMEEACALFLRQLLEWHANLRLLVTSRRRLNLEIEHEIPLSPLQVPDQPVNQDQLLECAAIQTFLERAKRKRPDFTLTERNAEAVRLLCHRLDGLPLAIELAAAWVPVMSPSQMLPRLEHRFELLVNRQRDTVQRHRTLKETVSWSYQMLPENLQKLLRSLSVFRGGWTTEAATWVCGKEAVEGLLTLLDHSLVASYPAGAEMQRWRMLETIREFAYEQLSPEERTTLCHRHALYYEGLLEQAKADGPPGVPRWMPIIEMERENIRAAVEWCLTESEPQLGVRIGKASDAFWRGLGYRLERLRWRELAFQRMADLPLDLQATVLENVAITGRPDAIELLERALEIYRALDDKSGIGGVFDLMAQFYTDNAQHDRAIELYQRALELRKQIGDKENYRITLANLTGHYTALGRYHESLPQLALCLRLNEEHNDAGTEAVLRRAIGEIKRQQGALTEAYEQLSTAQRIFEIRGEHTQIIRNLYALALVEAMRGDYESALAWMEQQQRLIREIAKRSQSRVNFRLRLELLWQMGRWEEFAEVYREAREQQQASIDSVTPVDQFSLLFAQAMLAEREGREEVTVELLQEMSKISQDTETVVWDEVARAKTLQGMLLWRLGHTDAAREAILHSMALCDRSGLLPEQERLLRRMGQQLVKLGRYEEAHPLLATAETLRVTGGWVIPPIERGDYDQAIQRLREALGLTSVSLKLANMPQEDWREVWHRLPALLE